MYILFDIGGTKMRVAASYDCKTYGEPRKIDTPKDFYDGVEAFKEIVNELSGGEEIIAAGGGIAGPLNRNRTELVHSPNLPGWVGKPICKEFGKAINAPVYLENDTAIVGLGEVHKGAGKGYDIAVYMTVSTGVGGVRIVDGFIDRSTFGSEPGHQIIDMTLDACTTCNVAGRHSDGPGHLEGYVSGTATEKRFNQKAYEIPQDNPLWDELARWLAYGLNNTIVHWSPDVVVLGGSMMIGDPKIPLEKVEQYLKGHLTIYPEIPDLRYAELKDEGGLHGALAFLKQHTEEEKTICYCKKCKDGEGNGESSICCRKA